jgi:hypothetical protein
MENLIVLELLFGGRITYQIVFSERIQGQGADILWAFKTFKMKDVRSFLTPMNISKFRGTINFQADDKMAK